MFFVLFYFFGQRSNFFDLLAQFSNMVVRSVFDLSKSTLWGKLFLFWRKNICVLTASDNDRIFFGLVGKHVWPSSYLFSSATSKLPSTCPEKQLEEMTFPRKKTNFFDVFGYGLKKTRASVKHFWKGLSKLISTWTEVNFEFKKSENNVTFYRFRILLENVSTSFSKYLYTSPE